VREVFPALTGSIGPQVATEAACYPVGGDVFTVGHGMFVRDGNSIITTPCGILSSVLPPSNRGDNDGVWLVDTPDQLQRRTGQTEFPKREPSDNDVHAHFSDKIANRLQRDPSLAAAKRPRWC
jgi:hypothetical protein